MSLFRVTTAFSIYDSEDEANPCAPASGQVVSFKPGDIVEVENEAGSLNAFISYKCDNIFGGGNSGLFGTYQRVPVDIRNLQPVSKCSSGYRNFETDCINPNTPVIDNTISGQQAPTSSSPTGMVKFFKNPFGLSPLLGYSALIGATAIATYIIIAISKSIKK